jgi:hypothetical protein
MPNKIQPPKYFTIDVNDAGTEAYNDSYVHNLEVELLKLRKEVERLMDTAELAWGLIANAYGGNWGIATDVWREAAERWRDERWHPELEEKCLTD